MRERRAWQGYIIDSDTPVASQYARVFRCYLIDAKRQKVGIKWKKERAGSAHAMIKGVSSIANTRILDGHSKSLFI